MIDIAGDVEQILNDGGDFSSEVIFSVTNGVTVVSKTCNAVVVNHNLTVTDEGVEINGRTSRVTVSELTLKALGYPTRNNANKIALKGHRVTWTDPASEVQVTFKIKEQFPNYQTGLIRCTLEDYGMATPPGRTIIGWISSKIKVEVVATPNSETQELLNGDEIPVQYALNDGSVSGKPAGSLTIPYLIGYGVGTPFMLNDFANQEETYNMVNATFDNTSNGSVFQIGDRIAFNASIPVWADA